MSIVRVVAAAALLAAMSGQQLSTCAGWSSSSQARMACCERRAGCDDPAMANACCAAGERDDHAQAGMSIVAPLPQASFHLRAPVPHVILRAAVNRFETSVPHAFRNAVLLI